MRTHTVIILHELHNPMQHIIQGLPVERARLGGPGSWVAIGETREWDGAHLHRTLKFLPSATCRRDRLLPMASTRVTMSEPKPGGGRWHRPLSRLCLGRRNAGWGRPYAHNTALHNNERASHRCQPDPGSSERRRRRPGLGSPEHLRSAAAGGKRQSLGQEARGVRRIPSRAGRVKSRAAWRSPRRR